MSESERREANKAMQGLEDAAKQWAPARSDDVLAVLRVLLRGVQKLERTVDRLEARAKAVGK